MKSLLFFQTSDQGWPACGRLGRQTSARTKTSARLKITFVDMTHREPPLCPLIFSWQKKWSGSHIKGNKKRDTEAGSMFYGSEAFDAATASFSSKYDGNVFVT